MTQLKQFFSYVCAGKIETSRRQPSVDDDKNQKNVEFDKHHLAELISQNMRANNVYVPTSHT